MRTVLIVVLLATFTLAVTLHATAEPNADRLLVSLAEVWGDVEYFDPQLARPNEWDAAALAAIPKVEAATTAPAFANAVAVMLASLGDPLNGVVPSPAPAAKNSVDGITVASPDSRTVVLTVDSATLAAESTELDARAAAVVPALRSKQTVIIDLRRNQPESSAEAAAVDMLFGITPLAASLAHGDVQLPTYRRRYYDGLASPFIPGWENYTGGFIVDDGITIHGSSSAAARVAFLVNAHTTVPDLAVALVRTGQGVIFSDGLAPALDGGDVDELQMDDGVTAQFRVTEYTEVPTGGSFMQPLPAGDAASAVTGWFDRHAPSVVAFQPAPPGISMPSIAGSAGFPDEPHRVFAVFRIYSAIRYFFPYRDLMNEDWPAATLRAIRDVRAAGDEMSYIRAIRRYYTLIHDGHGFVGGEPLGRLYGGGVPWGSRFLHGEIVVANVIDPLACAAAGVRAGDIVTAIDGIPARDAFAAQRPFVNGSTPQGVARNLVAGFATSVFAGPPGSGISVTLHHPGSSLVFTARFRRISAVVRHPRSGPIVRVLPGNVGYVDLDRLEAGDDVDKMFAALTNTRAIVFDDRGYPLGTAWSIAPRLTAGNEVRGALFDRVMALAPYLTDGEEYFKQSFRTFYQVLPPATGRRYLKPTVTLVDERTISQAEHTGLFFSAAGHTRFIGTPTAGANGDVTQFAIPGGLTLAFSGQGVRFADGRQLQRVGIVPDVRSEPTAADVATGRDVVLETGLREALRLAGVAQAESAAALSRLRSIERAEFSAGVREAKRTVALERTELSYVGKSLPGATGTRAITVALLSSDQDRIKNSAIRIDPAPYRGKDVHVFGMIRTVNAPQGGAFWLRVDGPKGPVALDNMSDRMPHATSDWQPFSIVLRVPDDAAGIIAGFLLCGRGEVSSSDLMIEAVPADTPTTSIL